MDSPPKGSELARKVDTNPLYMRKERKMSILLIPVGILIDIYLCALALR